MNGTSDDPIAVSIALVNRINHDFIGIFVIGFVAFVTNPLIVWTIWRQKVLHTGCFMLIAQLAVADFIIGTSFVLTMIKRLIRVDYHLGEIIPQLQCAIEMIPNYFSECASLCLALAIGCERLLGAAMPLKFMTYEWKVARAVSIIAWIIPVIDTSIMLGVMIAAPSNTINVCTASFALTIAYDAYQQTGRASLAVIVVLTYVLLLSAISLQLRAAKKRNMQNVTTFRKSLQLRMVRLLAAMAIMYFCFQMVPRFAIIYLNNLHMINLQLTYGAVVRLFMAFNTAIHFFVYLGTSTEFREAFLKEIRIRK